MTDFERINGPRAQRAVGQLIHIEKSAKSLRVHELDIVKLLEPVTAKLNSMKDPLAVEMVEDQVRTYAAKANLSERESLRMNIASAGLDECLTALTLLSARIDQLVKG